MVNPQLYYADLLHAPGYNHDHPLFSYVIYFYFKNNIITFLDSLLETACKKHHPNENDSHQLVVLPVSSFKWCL